MAHVVHPTTYRSADQAAAQTHRENFADLGNLTPDQAKAAWSMLVRMAPTTVRGLLAMVHRRVTTADKKD